ncbi:MAG: HAD-IA family hydrolase [Bacteroidota bacterium]
MKTIHFDAVIFDLDGVITNTAEVHSKAWKRMFDEFLQQWAEKNYTSFEPFTHQRDYLPYVDGKPRYKGVASFLASRNIEIPYGTPEDSPEKETVCGLGNRKNQKFNETLHKEGVKVFDSTVNFIHQLKEAGAHIGVASSSKNCGAVLEAAGLLDLFETRVDGEVSVKLSLKGKPEADIFTTAADNMNVSYARSVVVEDAVSGVQAGQNGRFGLVLGIAREANHDELYNNGADIVVSDMAEITLDDLNHWFEQGLPEDMWSISYKGFNPENERTHEALLTIGNGYFGTRGALEETSANDINYPGTYVAGLYNRLKTLVSGREVENEDFVNCPNWLAVSFKIDDGDWVSPGAENIKSLTRRLDFRTGLLGRTMVIVDEKGRETEITSQRLAGMKNPHTAILKYTLKALNYSGKVTITTGLNGDIINDGVKRYRQLNQQHLRPSQAEAHENLQLLEVETTQSGVRIAEAAEISIKANGKSLQKELDHSVEKAAVYSSFQHDIKTNESVGFEKAVLIYTTRESEDESPLQVAEREVKKIPGYDDFLKESKKVWDKLWSEMDVVVEGDRFSQKLLRLHMYHLMVSASPHNTELDAGITARGLHGEAYRGHVFWDELYILPFYFIHFPDVAKSLLMYRYRRLDEARKYAKEHGYEGAMFPWQSGSSGREETQTLHLNPVSGKWGPDHSMLQRHVSLAIAFNIWQYYHITDDKQFLTDYGAEMFLEICRFWASKAEYSADDGRYHIDRVMGPDEFHEKYPGKEEGGVTDNAYTNIMAVWAFRKAFTILDVMDDKPKKALLQKLQLTEDELTRWDEIEKNMNVIIKDDIIAQYDGFFELKELDWDAYRKKYDNIYRMDRILKAEGKSADDYKVSKQADTLMTFYILNQEEVTSILHDLGYRPGKNYLAKNLRYYLKRTSHGSTLSRVVHAMLASMSGDEKLSWEMYQDALASDYNDIQGGTTGEGIHVGVMSGTVMIALTTYGGINLNGDIPEINPNLPELWGRLEFGFHFKDVHYLVNLHKETLKIKASKKVTIKVYDKEYYIPEQEWSSVSLT